MKRKPINTSMRPVYVLERTPGAENMPTVAWLDVCRNQRWVMVRHNRTYEKSRWVHEDRKRPFAVSVDGIGEMSIRSWHATLPAAITAAHKVARECHKYDMADALAAAQKEQA